MLPGVLGLEQVFELSWWEGGLEWGVDFCWDAAAGSFHLHFLVSSPPESLKLSRPALRFGLWLQATTEPFTGWGLEITRCWEAAEVAGGMVDCVSDDILLPADVHSLRLVTNEEAATKLRFCAFT